MSNVFSAENKQDSKIYRSNMNLTKHTTRLLFVIVPIFLIGYSLAYFRNFPVEIGDYFKISTELLPLVLSFTIFMISWYSYGKSKDNQSLFIGASFLLIGVLTLYHMLSYSFMPSFITPNTLQKSTFFWGMLLMVTSALFLVSGFVHSGTWPHIMKKPVLIIEVNIISFILLTVGLIYNDKIPTLVYTDKSHSGSFIYLIIISSLIIAFSGILYLKRLREKPQDHLMCLIYGLVILIFSSFSYLYSDYSGNLLKAASFYFVYLWVYKSSIEQPYEKINVAEKKLRQIAEDRYRNLVDNANDAIITADLDGRIITWNKSAQNIFGWTAEEVTGKKISMLLIPPDKQAENEQLIHRILIGKGFSGFESVHKKKDGNKIDVSLTISPLNNIDHRIVGLSCVIRDISDSKRAEEIKDENMRLGLLIRAKSELLPSMSHDLGTPLNAMIGFSELLINEMPGKLNEKQKKYVEHILASSKRMLDIINDILDLGKAETGKIELNMEKISVHETIDEVAGLFREDATKRNVVFKKEPDPELNIIEADRKRFKQILFNLLSNAVKYSKPEGGIVTIKTVKRGELAKFEVSDTGTGIREKDMGRLFTPFEQLDLGIASKYGSTGLGLVITKKLVEMHGGIIDVKSTYGEGSTFTFTFLIGGKKDCINNRV
jgi:PAS domain S-box-containing protein